MGLLDLRPEHALDARRRVDAALIIERSREPAGNEDAVPTGEEIVVILEDPGGGIIPGSNSLRQPVDKPQPIVAAQVSG